MPEQSYPPYVAGAKTIPRQLQRWLDVNPQNGSLRRVATYITIPAFGPLDVIITDYSVIIGEFHYSAPNNFSLKNFTPPTDPDHTLCISYVESDNTVVRYYLYRTANTDVIYDETIQNYSGQLIKKNFRIEVWSAVDVPSANLATAFNIYTSVLGSIDYRYGIDYSLVSADSLCTGQYTTTGPAAPVTPDPTDLYGYFTPFAGVTQVANLVSQWTSQGPNAHDLIQATGAKQPTLDLVGNTGGVQFLDDDNLLSSGTTGVALPDVWIRFIWPVGGATGSRIFRMIGTGQAFSMFGVLGSSTLHFNFNGVTQDIDITGYVAFIINIDFANGIMKMYDWVTGLLFHTHVFAGFTSVIVSLTLGDGTSVAVGQGSFINDVVLYLASQTPAAKQVTLDYLLGQSQLTMIPLPFEWGQCAQPTLNS